MRTGTGVGRFRQTSAPTVWRGYLLTSGNHLQHYEDGDPAFAAMLESIRGARKHIHLETFIFQPDDLGALFRGERTHGAGSPWSPGEGAVRRHGLIAPAPKFLARIGSRWRTC